MKVYKRIKVETHKVEENDEEKCVQTPFVRVTLDGEGCPLPGCMCSGDNYIAISDGETILNVKLTESQVQQLVKHGTLWLDDNKGVGRNELDKVLEDFSPF